MNRSKTILAVLLIVVIAAALVWVVRPKDDKTKPYDNTTASKISNNEQVTVTGVLVCLPHKDTSSPQTMECASGIQTTDDIYYALRDETANNELTNTSYNNVEVEVTGTITLEESDIYQSSGTIAVTSITLH